MKRIVCTLGLLIGLMLVLSACGIATPEATPLPTITRQSPPTEGGSQQKYTT